MTTRRNYFSLNTGPPGGNGSRHPQGSRQAWFLPCPRPVRTQVQWLSRTAGSKGRSQEIQAYFPPEIQPAYAGDHTPVPCGGLFCALLIVRAAVFRQFKGRAPDRADLNELTGQEDRFLHHFRLCGRRFHSISKTMSFMAAAPPVSLLYRSYQVRCPKERTGRARGLCRPRRRARRFSSRKKHRGIICPGAFPFASAAFAEACAAPRPPVSGG